MKKTQATKLKKHKENVYFIFQATLHTMIFEFTNLVSKVLQSN